MAPLRFGFAARAATVVVALLACAGLASAVQREYYWNEVTNVSQWEIPDVAVAYEDKATGKKYYVDPDSGEKTKQFDGKVIPESETTAAQSAVANGQPFCVETAPSLELQWVPHADGPYVWEVEIEDLEGNSRTLISQVNVIEEAIETQRIDFDTQRGDE